MWHKEHKYLYLLTLCLLSLSLLISCSSVATSSIASETTLDLTIALPDTDNKTILMDEQGRVLESAQITSSDGNIGLAIDKGTILLDEEKKPLQSITVVIDPLIPVTPENVIIVGPIVEIQSQGAIAKPSLKLILTYDPSVLPQGFNENDLWIYENTGNIWNRVPYRLVRPEANIITTAISRFGQYSVVATTIPIETTTPLSQNSLTVMTLSQALVNGKPTLAEFGRGTCIPCKKMKPILEDLAEKYQDKLNVCIVSIDEYKDLTSYYKVMGIPTQIIFDSNGKEIYRHIGYWSDDKIIDQFGKLGITQ